MATLGGAVLLVGIGFVGGIVAGVVTEEPGLVWAYLSGESVEATLPEVAAGVPSRPRPDLVRKAPSPTEQPATAPVVRSGFAVQVGAFKVRGQAESLEAKLAAEGHRVYISSRNGKHRVRVGPVDSRPDAEALAERLGKQALPTWILAE